MAMIVVTKGLVSAVFAATKIHRFIFISLPQQWFKTTANMRIITKWLRLTATTTTPAITLTTFYLNRERPPLCDYRINHFSLVLCAKSI
jgi:hypothetical protein